MKVNKVIIPVAGLGTRMLPASKAIPKEMFPIINKPVIQYIVEEVKNAGFKEIIFVTHSSKYSIENHFDTSFELEAALEKRVKRSLLREIRSISKLKVNIQSIRQGEAKGLGHAILCAKSIIGNEPFAVVLPDMVINGSNRLNNLSLMKEIFETNNNSSILLAKAKQKDINKYGIAKVKKIKHQDFSIIEKIIEKPSLKRAPSNLYAVGRYIFENNIIEFLEKVSPDKSGEIQLTDAIDLLLKEKIKILGINLEGNVFDCGEKFGFLAANIEFSKNDTELKKQIKEFLKKYLQEN